VLARVAGLMDAGADVAAEPWSLRPAKRRSPGSTQVAPALPDSHSLTGPDGCRHKASDSVDQLKGEAAGAGTQADAAQREAQRVEKSGRELAEQVGGGREAQQRGVQQDVEYWRQRCLVFESECATLAVREDTAQAQLREALCRERNLAVENIEGRILCTQAENLQAKAQAEARANTSQSQQLEAKLLAKNAEVDSLRDEVCNARARGEASRVEAESLQAQLRAFLGERVFESEALIDAEHKQAVLQDRIKSLEAALQAASTKHAVLAQEVAKNGTETWNLEETNRRLRLDLQEAVSQALLRPSTRPPSEMAFYSEVGGSFQQRAACVEDLKDVPTMGVWSTMESNLPRPLSSPSPRRSAKSPLSPGSRFDYPKSSHARHLRQKILSARGEAYEQVADLRRERQ